MARVTVKRMRGRPTLVASDATGATASEAVATVSSNGSEIIRLEAVLREDLERVVVAFLAAANDEEDVSAMSQDEAAAAG